MSHTYPELIERLKALFADSIFVVLMMYTATTIFESMQEVDQDQRILAFVIIFLLYDPLTTSLLGGTFGHMLMRLRVKQLKNENKNIWFPIAVLRYLIKTLLGTVSLLTISGSKKGLAIHDRVCRSVVIKKPQKKHEVN